jgi:hypothetical protein
MIVIPDTAQVAVMVHARILDRRGRMNPPKFKKSNYIIQL